MRKFDLNIQKILANWEPANAIRELIANALDEQKLTNTKEIEIKKITDGEWTIRDFGRGITENALVQNENKEKIESKDLIGQFGIGLKDAIATLYRHKINISIQSKHIYIEKVEMGSKSNFDDITTLHAVVDDDKIQKDFVGTEITLTNVKDDDIKKAKDFFIEFLDHLVLEDNEYGQIIKLGDGAKSIFINGVKVAEEPNFVFSYNITNLNKKIRKALNRERTNIGRDAYSERVQKIVITTKPNNFEVIEPLQNEFKKVIDGENSDELSWFDVQKFIMTTFDASKYVFLSIDKYRRNSALVDEIVESQGKEIMLVPPKLSSALPKMKDMFGGSLTGWDEMIDDYRNSFTREYVGYEELTPKEKAMFDKKDEIMNYVNKKATKVVKEVKIAKQISPDEFFGETKGLWIGEEQTIIIKRNQLDNLTDFSGTLIHETIHAVSGFGDYNREFENELTMMIGRIYSQLYK